MLRERPMPDALDALARAGVVTHVAAVREQAGWLERNVVDALLAATSGPVFRLSAFSYGLELQPGTETDVAARLADQLGSGTVDLTTAPGGAADGDRHAPAVRLLRAMAGSVTQSLAEEGPMLRAVIDARFAVAAAELTVEGLTSLGPAPGPMIADRLDQLTAAVEAMRTRTETLTTASDAVDLEEVRDRLGQIEAGLAALTDRSDLPPDEGMAGLLDRLERIEHRLAAAADQARDAPSQLALLARLDRQVAAIEALSERLATDQRNYEEIGARLDAIETGRWSPDAGFDALKDRVETLTAEIETRDRGQTEALARIGHTLAEFIALSQWSSHSN